MQNYSLFHLPTIPKFDDFSQVKNDKSKKAMFYELFFVILQSEC